MSGIIDHASSERVEDNQFYIFYDWTLRHCSATAWVRMNPQRKSSHRMKRLRDIHSMVKDQIIWTLPGDLAPTVGKKYSLQRYSFWFSKNTLFFVSNVNTQTLHPTQITSCSKIQFLYSLQYAHHFILIHLWTTTIALASISQSQSLLTEVIM